MSTLVAQTISNGVVSTSSANVIQGSAKAWVNFNGTGTVAIRASYNVSSITDNGTGEYTVNFTNALPNANYSVAGAVGGTNASYCFNLGQSTSLTTTSCTVASVNPNIALADSAYVTVAIFSS